MTGRNAKFTDEDGIKLPTIADSCLGSVADFLSSGDLAALMQLNKQFYSEVIPEASKFVIEARLCRYGRGVSWSPRDRPPLQFLRFLDRIHRRPVSVAIGENHSVVAVPENCGLFAAGKGSHGRLGAGTTRNASLPVRVQSLSGIRVLQVAVGEDHSVALSADGIVYTFGKGEYGRLGHGNDQDTHFPCPVEIPGASRITSIAAGGAHTIVLDTEGRIWSCGWNFYGQLGTASFSNEKSMILVPAAARMIDCAAGSYHSQYQSSCGRIWSTGGRDQSCAQPLVNTLQEIPACTSASLIAAGGEFSSCLTETNALYIWRWRFNVQVGAADYSKVHLPSAVRGIWTSNSFTSALLMNGEAYAVRHKQTSGSDDDPCDVSVTLVAESTLGIVEMAVAEASALFRTVDKRILCWGSNRYGKLGVGHARDIPQLTVIPAYSSLFGSEEESAEDVYVLASANLETLLESEGAE